MKSIIEKFDYENIEEADRTHYGRMQLRFTHRACGTTQVWTLTNLEKVLKADPNTAPCSKCGGVRRMKTALNGYIAKYGIDPARIDEWEIYRSTVRRLTEKTYRAHHATINPLGLKRGMRTYHLDHQMPIIEGFVRGLKPEIVAEVQNLQLLPATENLSKGRK